MSDLKEARSSKEKPLKHVLLAGIHSQPRSGYELAKWLRVRQTEIRKPDR